MSLGSDEDGAELGISLEGHALAGKGDGASGLSQGVVGVCTGAMKGMVGL